MRKKFDEQLNRLNEELIEMGNLVESAIASAVKAFTTGSEEMAREAINFEEEIDRKEKEIESICLQLLLQQQPVARDLRVISSALKMITDLERIGDMAEDISEITLLIREHPYTDRLNHIPHMALATIAMVNGSIDAYVKKDPDLAKKVIADDDTVDNLFNIVKSDLLKLIISAPEDGDEILDFLMVAKYFERIGDHATNIAEWAAFSME